MLLRTQIILIFLSILIIAIGMASLFHYRTAREARLQEVYNHMESISEANKLRLKGIIRKRQEQIAMLQIREQLRENLSRYLRTRDKASLLAMTTTLETTRDRIASFKELHLVSMQGKVEASSSPQYVGSDFSGRESFRHALDGEVCMHEFFYDENKSLSIHISGLLALEGENIGVIVVQTDAEDILSIINDYTGLGETGETTLARRVDDMVVYLTPTRFFPLPGDTLILPDDPERAMSLALAGEEKLQPEVLDYRGERVVASPRYLPEIGWGLTTKVDRKEAMAPITGLLRRTFLLALVLVVAVSVAAHFFAKRLVRPIVSLGEASREIANGDLEKRISYSGRNEVGQLASSFNLMADKLVETNKALERKVQELDRINESLNRFAHVVSHDLKSPLHSISALIGFLQESLRAYNEPDVHKMLGMAEAKVEHMQGLIAGILDYSMSGITGEKKEPVDLNGLVEEIIPHLDVPSHIQLTIEPLPVVKIERVMMLQVLQNLLGNAIKYMDKPLGWVVLGYSKEDNYFKFYVRDNGRGIERRNFDKVFDIFNKTHELTGVDSSGLGLSIAKRIVESKGGRIWVESVVGTGSTFFFTLPVDVVS
jgi:signal transduction histidine kinase